MEEINVNPEIQLAILQRGLKQVTKLTNYMDQLGNILELYQTGKVDEDTAEAMVDNIITKGDKTMAEFEQLSKLMDTLSGIEERAAVETEDE